MTAPEGGSFQRRQPAGQPRETPAFDRSRPFRSRLGSSTDREKAAPNSAARSSRRRVKVSARSCGFLIQPRTGRNLQLAFDLDRHGKRGRLDPVQQLRNVAGAQAKASEVCGFKVADFSHGLVFTHGEALRKHIFRMSRRFVLAFRFARSDCRLENLRRHPMAIPASNIIILDHSAESRRAMRLALASMGTLGVNVRHTTGHVALMFGHYRTAQRSVGGPGAICGTPAAWRGKVRKSIAAARAARQALQVAA